MTTVMSEEVREVPAIACCSVGIGRWYWVAWESEAEARALSPALAFGYEKSAEGSEAKAAERFGPSLRRLPPKWASSYKRGGGAARAPVPKRFAGEDGEPRPKSRFGRPAAKTSRPGVSTRLAFLYSAAEREPPDALGHVTVARHRIVKQTAQKIHVEYNPFDPDEWALR